MDNQAVSDTDTEEEILVYAEFENSVNIEKYRSIHILGISEKNPIIQTDDTFFRGTFKNPLGTYMFFEEDPSPHCSDPLFDKIPEKNLKYLYKTRKALSMEHAYVIPNAEQNSTSKSQPHDDHMELIHFKSVQEALDQFKNSFNSDNTTCESLDQINVDTNISDDDVIITP